MVPAESAHDTIGALGDVGLLQFKDLNADKSAFQRTYANQVRFISSLMQGPAPAGLHAETYAPPAASRACAREGCDAARDPPRHRRCMPALAGPYTN